MDTPAIKKARKVAVLIDHNLHYDLGVLNEIVEQYPGYDGFKIYAMDLNEIQIWGTRMETENELIARLNNKLFDDHFTDEFNGLDYAMFRITNLNNECKDT